MTEVAQSRQAARASLPASGLLEVDKPRGVTSHDIVAAARAVLHTKHVGHAGTLDPMATGLLIVGFGSATRLLSYIVGDDKTYETTIRLGQGTTTDDADGDPLPRSSEETTAVAEAIRRLSDEDIHKAADCLTGDLRQVPSAFSAKKIHGQKAYDLARNGDVVKLEAQPVTVYSFEILGIRRTMADAAGTTPGGALRDQPVIDVDARITCSSGTYIRALGRDMGAALGTGAHLVRLRRTRVGSFDVTDPDVVAAHAQDHTFVNRQGETVTHPWAVFDEPETLGAHAMSPADGARRAMPTMRISAQQADDLRHGRFIEGIVHGPTAAIVSADGCDDEHRGDGIHGDGTGGEASAADTLVAIVERRTKRLLKPSVVF